MKKTVFAAFLLFFCLAPDTSADIFFKSGESNTEVVMNRKKLVKNEKNLWMIVKPHQYRYLFVIRSFFDPATNTTSYDNPAMWSDNAGAWPNNGGFLDLKYVKATLKKQDSGNISNNKNPATSTPQKSREIDFFHHNAATFTIIKEDGPTAAFRMDYSSSDLSCALIFSYKERDKKLVLHVIFEPHVEIEKYILTFSCQTSGNRNSVKKHLLTGDKKLVPANDFVRLDPLQDYRFIYTSEETDKNMPFALLAMPNQADRCEALVTKWSFKTRFVYSGNCKKASFLLYDKWDDFAKGMEFLKKIHVEPATTP